MHQLGGKLREPIELPLRISVLDGDVLSFYVAKLAQSQPNCLGTGGVISWIVVDRYPIRELLRLIFPSAYRYSMAMFCPSM